MHNFNGIESPLPVTTLAGNTSHRVELQLQKEDLKSER